MREQWFQLLRKQLKSEHGKGWGVRAMRGKVQLTLRVDESAGMKNPRNSVSLPLDWSADNQTKILNFVNDIRERMEANNLSLKEAAKLTAEPLADDQQQNVQVNWVEAVNRFLTEEKAGLRETTLRDTKLRLNRVLQVLDKTPRPRNGVSLMKRYAEVYFDESLPIGGSGRKRNLNDVAAFLNFAVEECGAKEHWRPLTGKKLQKVIGDAVESTEDKPTPPIKTHDLEMLMAALESNNKPQLRLAVGLVGLFGLRPAELAVLSVEDGKLFVGNVKRNRKMKKKEQRRVIPLDLPSLPNEGARLVKQLESGLVSFPIAIQNAIKRSKAKERPDFKDVGDAFRQLLDRYWAWKQLKIKEPDLSPYSMRHGYAWRAHQEGDRAMSIRACAALMGHNPNVHTSHYGKWTDEAGLEEAVALHQGKKVLV